MKLLLDENLPKRLKIDFILLVLAFGLFCIFYSCNNNPKEPGDNNPPVPATPVINYAVAEYLPHSTDLFTEGFLIHNGQFFESTGSPEEVPQARSLVGSIDTAIGKMDIKIELDKTKYFGEGIVFLNNKLYQLTYKTQVGFIYDAKTFKKLGQFSYANKEGWSLTTDGTYLIMSDGTSALTFLNHVDLKPANVLQVTENGIPRDSINELAYIKGFIYANIWESNYIVKIDPVTGKVTGKIDLGSLTYEARNKNPNADVLNGIAYDSATDKIYVTGKMWPNIYQINFAH